MNRLDTPTKSTAQQYSSGGFGDARERRVAAIAAAVDRDALGIGQAFGDRPMHAVGDVVLHCEAPLAVARLQVVATVPGRAAVVHLQDRVATVREELNLGVKAPRVAYPRAAVGMHDQGQRAAIVVLGHGQVAGDHAAIARGVANRLHRRELVRVEPRREVEQRHQAKAGGAAGVLGVERRVEQQVAPERAVAGRMHDIALFGLGKARQVVFVAGQLGVHERLERLAARVPKHLVGLVGFKGDAARNAPLFGAQEVRHVDLVVLKDQLADAARVGIHLKDRRALAPDVTGDPQVLVVKRKAERRDRFLEVVRPDHAELVELGRAVQDRRVDAVGRRRKPHIAVVVGDPALHVAGVFGDDFHVAAREVEAVDVKAFGIALVHLEQDLARLVFEVVDDRALHTVKRREVARLAFLGTDDKQVPVFVAVLVHDVHQVIVVDKRIAADVTRADRGALQGARGIKAVDRRAEFGDKQVHAPHGAGFGFERDRRQPSDARAVRREAHAGALGFAKEVFEWDHGITGGRGAVSCRTPSRPTS